MHFCLHRPWFGPFYLSHQHHHMVAYPNSDFSSEVYRSSGIDSTFIFFAIAGLPILAIPITLWWLGILSPILACLSLGQMLFMGLLNNYLHDQVHLNNSWIFQYPFGRFLRKLHRIHHRSQNKNLGIYLFWIDRLLKTYES